MPETLEAGILYVSEKYGAAAHLCACGCGAKIRTPIGPTDWKFENTSGGPTLYPSIGNWQQACRSHYWIRRGNVVPAPDWTDNEIEAGRAAERKRDHAYYDSLSSRRRGTGERAWDWLKAKLRL